MKAGSYRWKRPGVAEFRLRLGNDPITGKPVRKSHTWKGPKSRVAVALAQWVADETQSTKIEPTSETVTWLVKIWIDLQEQAGLSPTTIRTYRSYYENWIVPLVGYIAIGKLTAGDVRELHAAMTVAGKSDSTIRQVHNILRGSLTFAVEKEWVPRNVATLRRPPKQGTPKVLAATLEEIRSLLAAAGDPGCDLWACIALAAVLGARAGELCALRWSDVDLKARTVTIARSAYPVKGGGAAIKGVKSDHTRQMRTSRTLSIDDDLTVAVLETRHTWQFQRWQRVAGGSYPTDLIEDPFVLSFWSDGSGPPRPDGYSKSFRLLADSLGLPHVHLHSLRHFMVSDALDKGVPLAVVSERAGHSSPAVTARIYTHAVAGRDKEAAAILGRVLGKQAEI